MRTPRYAWLTWRRESLWFPGALLALFVLIAWWMDHPDARFAIARAYLGFFVPLVGGILASHAILDDPALELRFATPVTAAGTLGSRLGLILSVEAACALAFLAVARGMGVDLSPLGGARAVQLAWLVPTVSLCALGTFASLWSARCATGSFAVAAVWLGQLLLRGWLHDNARYLYLFLGVLDPGSPDVPRSRATLLVASLALLTGSWRLLRRPERYLGGTR